jgi:transposase-like protein
VFCPPRCPNSGCPAHHIETLGTTDFYIHKGSYHPKCRSRPVPRFKCKVCSRGFSRQTFRQDYCDNKPHLNAKLFELLASGLGLRQSGRILELSRRCVELKARKMARHLGNLDHNLLDQFPRGSSFQMDEMETFENERRVCPLTLPVVIEQESMLIVAAESAPIRASGRMSTKRLEAIARREEAEGRREDHSRGCLKRVFRRTSRFCKRLEIVGVDTDEKTTYPGLARWAFGRKLRHQSFSSKLPRDTSNPLFPINLTNAMARDLNGRLRRRSWLASKRGRYLNLQMNVFMAYRNFVRPRYNGEGETPAQLLGFVTKQMTPRDLLSWRQDWGWYSVHPLSRRTSSIRAVRARERAQGMASHQMTAFGRSAA